MMEKRCEICETPISSQDFFFVLAKGRVCSNCIVEYGFRVTESENPARPSPRMPAPLPACNPERLLDSVPTPAETINRALPKRPDLAAWLGPSFAA